MRRVAENLSKNHTAAGLARTFSRVHGADVQLPLAKMTREEKLQAMEAIWTDLSQDEGNFESPAWHADELRATEERVRQGKEKFSDWDEAKERIRRKASGSS